MIKAREGEVDFINKYPGVVCSSVLIFFAALVILLIGSAGCTPKPVMQPKIDSVFVPVPQDRVVIADSGFQEIMNIHDTVLNTDTVIVTKWQYRTITNVKNVVDTQKIIVDRHVCDTVLMTKEVSRGVPVWLFWLMIGVSGGAIIFIAARKL